MKEGRKVGLISACVGFCPTPVGLCPHGLLSYGLMSYGLLSGYRSFQLCSYVKVSTVQLRLDVVLLGKRFNTTLRTHINHVSSRQLGTIKQSFTADAHILTVLNTAIQLVDSASKRVCMASMLCDRHWLPISGLLSATMTICLWWSNRAESFV